MQPLDLCTRHPMSIIIILIERLMIHGVMENKNQGDTSYINYVIEANTFVAPY